MRSRNSASRAASAAAVQLRDLRAQLLAFRRVLFAPQFGVKTRVDV
jgi:hypothetical protein